MTAMRGLTLAGLAALLLLAGACHPYLYDSGYHYRGYPAYHGGYYGGYGGYRGYYGGHGRHHGGHRSGGHY